MSLERIKSGARVVFTLDVIVAVAWAACSLSILGTHCLDLVPSQLWSFIHFGVQTVALATLFEEIRKDEWDERHEGKHSPVFIPIAWPLASVVALIGDVLILCYDALRFPDIAPDDVCQKVATFQLAVDAGNTFVAALSLICFIGAVAHIKKHYRSDI